MKIRAHTINSAESSISPPHTDIAIIGGGMVGLSLALLLARKQGVLEKYLAPQFSPQQPQPSPWRITVIDRFALPENVDRQGLTQYRSSFDARSTAIAHSSRGILELAGLWPTLEEHLTPILQVHVSDRGHFGGALISAEDYQLSALGYVVENAWLGKVLAQRVQPEPSIDALMPAQVDDLSACAGGYRLSIRRNGQISTLQARLVIVAEGIGSQLRERLGIGVDVRDYDQVAVVANVAGDRPHGGVAYERFTDQGPLALLPLGENPESNISALVWTHFNRDIDTIMSLDDEAFLQTLQQRFGFRLGRLRRVSRRHSYPLQLQVAREQVRRSLVVMGNAAHFLHPVAGQGFNLALRDCEALVLALLRGQMQGRELGDPEVLQSYVDSQSWDQWATINLSDSLVRMFSNKQLLTSISRNLGLLGLDALPPAKRMFGRQAMGYTVG